MRKSHAGWSRRFARRALRVANAVTARLSRKASRHRRRRAV
jgi:hypothetical protein